MQTPFEKIIALFPERSLVIRSGSDTRYIVLKTWHQLMAACIAGLFFIWSTAASVGFSWNYDARLVVEAELAKTCLLYTSPSPRDGLLSRMPSSA